MKTKIAFRLCLLAFGITVAAISFSCSEAPDPTSSSSKTLIESTPERFKASNFRAVDDKMVLRIVGPTEAEISMGGENYVCSYTEEGGEIRAVLEILGTKKALYFKKVKDGLKDRDGVILFDSDHYESVMQEVNALRRQDALNKSLLKAANAGNLSDGALALQEGAEITTKNSRGMTALHLAAGSGNPELVRLLLEHGATANTVSPTGLAPLHFAADAGGQHGFASIPRKAGYDEILRILIKEGANLDVQSEEGFTPMMLALFHKNREAVGILVEAGASRAIRSKKGKTAWDYGPHDWLRTSEEAARYEKARTETKQVGTCKDVKRTNGRATRGGIIVTDVSVKPTTYGQFGGEGAAVYFMDLSGPPEKEPYPNATWGWNGFKIKFSTHSDIVFRSESARDECYDIILKAYQECVEKFKEVSAER